MGKVGPLSAGAELPSDVVEIEKNKISRSEEVLPIILQLHITWTNRLS